MIEVLKQAAEDVSKAYDILAFAHTERALELLAKTRTSLRQAIAQLALDGKAENARELGLDYELVCPECKAGVLYECVACSSNNYPPQEQQSCDKRTWVGLTDDEYCDIWYKESLDWMEYGKAIEAKLKEKNNA
jgi:hypothetical protein